MRDAPSLPSDKGYPSDGPGRLLGETVLYFTEVPDVLPRDRAARPVHVSTLVRWKDRGVRGVRLEAVRVGGRWATSREALARFFSGLTVASGPAAPPTPAGGLAADQGRVSRALDREGI